MRGSRLWREVLRVACVGLAALIAGCGGCPPEPDQYSNGVGLFLAGHQTAAAVEFAELLREHPRSVYAPDAEYFLGAIALQQGRTKQAEAHFRASLVSPRNEQMELNASLGLARCYLMQQQPRQAIAQCQEILAQHPSSPRADEVLYVLAQAYEADGQTELARRYYAQVKERFPSGSWASKAEDRLLGRSPMPTATAGSGPCVQVMALREQRDAEEHARLLRGRGYPAAVVAISAGGSTLYAVRVGPYATEADAKRIAAKLKAQGFEAIIKP